jgi:hypothetical protein
MRAEMRCVVLLNKLTIFRLCGGGFTQQPLLRPEFRGFWRLLSKLLVINDMRFHHHSVDKEKGALVQESFFFSLSSQ